MAELFEQSHPGFRVNFLLCAVKRAGKKKIFADLREFVELFNEEFQKHGGDRQK